MKPICIIPIRCGSKGLRDKNMAFLDKKPLVFHSIDAALETGLFSDIYVSSDSEEYLSVCRERPVKLHRRAAALAGDRTSTAELLLDFLKDFPAEQDFVLLQATSPLRDSQDICQAYHLFVQTKCSVVSVSEAAKHPRLFSSIDAAGNLPDIIGIDKDYRRQELSAVYYPNGAIYISNIGKYRKEKSFFLADTKAFVMAKSHSVDIDDASDFRSALGSIYFDYRRRREWMDGLCRELYKKNTAEQVILGDSRMKPLHLEGYANAAIGGLSVHSISRHIEQLLQTPVKKIFLAAGVNDLLMGYSLEEIKDCFRELVSVLERKGITLILGEVLLTLYRPAIQNEDILLLNEFLRELADEKQLLFIRFNDIFASNNHLDYSYTFDGLHLKPAAYELLQKRILHD